MEHCLKAVKAGAHKTLNLRASGDLFRKHARASTDESGPRLRNDSPASSYPDMTEKGSLFALVAELQNVIAQMNTALVHDETVAAPDDWQ